MIWTPEQDNRIAELLRAKKTASEIGAELGRSRNAIIGRVARCAMLKEIGFARAPGDKTGIRYKKPSARKVMDDSKRSKVQVIRPKPVAAKPVSVQPPTERHHVGRPLGMLLACRCKFAITPHDAPKGAHLFCGEVTEPGKSWCAWHEQIVWGRGTAGETATIKSAERLAA